MAYYKEETEKGILMAGIRNLATKLDVGIVFDSLDDMTYGNLVDLYGELVDQYEEAVFNKWEA